MSGHAGLTKVTKNVRGKKGMVRRSYWVRGKDAVKAGAKKLGSFVSRHKGKIAGAAALAGAAYLGTRHGSQIGGALSGARWALSGGGRSLLGNVREAAAAGARLGRWRDSARMNRIGGAVRSATGAVSSRAAKAGSAISKSARGAFGSARKSASSFGSRVSGAASAAATAFRKPAKKSRKR